VPNPGAVPPVYISAPAGQVHARVVRGETCLRPQMPRGGVPWVAGSGRSPYSGSERRDRCRFVRSSTRCCGLWMHSGRHRPYPTTVQKRALRADEQEPRVKGSAIAGARRAVIPVNRLDSGSLRPAETAPTNNPRTCLRLGAPSPSTVAVGTATPWSTSKARSWGDLSLATILADPIYCGVKSSRCENRASRS
jgi:hypothetical protein